MVERTAPVTDLSGVGAATAETLADRGITTVGDAVADYERTGGQNLPNQRVISAARSAAIELGTQGGETFADPTLGVEITSENRHAVETLGTKTISDLGSVDTTRAKELEAVGSKDTTLAELVEPARQGELGRQGAGQNLVGWATDAAGNITDDPLGSGGLHDLNRAEDRRDEEVRTSPHTEDGTATYQGTSYTFEVGDWTRAAATHDDRPPEAERVDENRHAPLTTEYSTWAADPSHYDFPAVDTPRGTDYYFEDYRRRGSRYSFGSTKPRANRDKRTLRRHADWLSKLDAEVQARLTGDDDAFDVDVDEIFGR